MTTKRMVTPKTSGKTSTTRATKTNSTVLQSGENLLSQIKIDIKHKNEIQKKLTQAIKENDVTLCVGPAGTGKTLLSVAEALILLKNNPDKYHEIKLVKSVIQLKGEDVGTLPGDEKDKLKHIMMSFLDAFYKLIGEELTNKLLEVGYVKMEVFGSVRGRSLSNCIILFDEFQNVSDNNGKTLLTRFSENTKVVALGDSNQIDLPNPETSCLSEIIHFAKIMPEEGVAVVEFSESDIVRHRLTKYFISIFQHKDYKKKNEVKIKTEKSKKTTFFQKFINFLNN